jgi:nitrate reductase NapAB chaperone NapD
MKKLEELTKEQIIEKNNELMKMLEDSLHKLTKIGIELCDATIDKLKLVIENDELKQKLSKYENTNT